MSVMKNTSTKTSTTCCASGVDVSKPISSGIETALYSTSTMMNQSQKPRKVEVGRMIRLRRAIVERPSKSRSESSVMPKVLEIVRTRPGMFFGLSERIARRSE